MQYNDMNSREDSVSPEWVVNKNKEFEIMSFSKKELVFDVTYGIDYHNNPYPEYLVQPTKNNELFIIKNGEMVPKTPELRKKLNRRRNLRFTGNFSLFVLTELSLLFFTLHYENYTHLTSSSIDLALEFFRVFTFFLFVIIFFAVIVKQRFSIFKTNSLNYYKKDLNDDNYYFYGIVKKGFTLADNEKAKEILSDNHVYTEHNYVLYKWWLNLLWDGDKDDLARMVLDRSFSSLDGTDDNIEFIRHIHDLVRVPKSNYYHFVDFLKNFDNLSKKGPVSINQLGELHNAKINTDNDVNNSENKTLLSREENTLEKTNTTSLLKTDLIKEIKEDYNILSEKFLDSQINPETIIYKPLLLDVSYSHTAKMIKSFNKAKESMGTTDYENIDDLKELKRIITIADNHFSKAETEAIRIGIPNIDEDARLTAIKSLKIVLDINAYESEKLAHWNNVLKIVRKTGMKEELINKANNSVTYEIKNKKRLELT